MKVIKLLALLFVFGLVFTSCSESEAIEEILENDQSTTFKQVQGKKALNANLFCDNVQISNLVNGPLMRSGVSLTWTVDNQLSGLPELVTYTVQFQVGSGGISVFGQTFSFSEDELIFPGSQQTFTKHYSSLSQLNGHVSGRWRVRVEDCDWSDWKNHYFN
ncbi:hypothetical protein [Tenacibaculum amylolyticum]|uniref:hypothetical protein n=1 Tax=Tenacibaculum amylolyticum TaxID=104269 RepID=UPI0038943289